MSHPIQNDVLARFLAFRAEVNKKRERAATKITKKEIRVPAVTKIKKQISKHNITKEKLATLVESGNTIRGIARLLGAGSTTIRYHLIRFGLNTKYSNKDEFKNKMREHYYNGKFKLLYQK